MYDGPIRVVSKLTMPSVWDRRVTSVRAAELRR
jgi:hypothetical protein